MARGPLRHRAQCSRIGCIGFRPALAAAVIEHRRFMFFHSFETQCVTMAVIHVLHALKFKL